MGARRAPYAALALLVLTVGLAACGERAEQAAADSAATAQASVPPPSTAPSADAARPAEDAGTAITTTNGAVTMALAGDRIVVHLSDSLVGQVRSKFDSGAAKDSGSFGGMIARIAKSAVSSALATPIEYPLTEIEDASYDGEAIRFRFTGDAKRAIEHTKVDDRPLLASFAPDDARRFVEAVRAAKGRQAEVR